MKIENKGFSLVELIIVIAIMAVLIGTLVPQYIRYVERSKRSKDEQMADDLSKTAEILAVDEDFCAFLKDGDYIRFDATGITTNNKKIADDALDECVPDWRSAKVQSKTYQSMYYEVEFVTYMDNYKLAVREGWKTNG